MMQKSFMQLLGEARDDKQECDKLPFPGIYNLGVISNCFVWQYLEPDIKVYEFYVNDESYVGVYDHSTNEFIHSFLGGAGIFEKVFPFVCRIFWMRRQNVIP
jgi:hypothetical protein